MGIKFMLLCWSFSVIPASEMRGRDDTQTKGIQQMLTTFYKNADGVQNSEADIALIELFVWQPRTFLGYLTINSEIASTLQSRWQYTVFTVSEEANREYVVSLLKNFRRQLRKLHGRTRKEEKLLRELKESISLISIREID